MKHPSLGRLGLLRIAEAGRIAVSPYWVCDHAVLVECGLAADFAFDDGAGEEEAGALEVVFEADFSLDDGDEAGGGEDDLFLIIDAEDEDDEDDEDDWPP